MYPSSSNRLSPKSPFQQDDNTAVMPLRGHQGRLYNWCAVCRATIPAEHKTLWIHLNRVHDLDFIPGCKECNYFRS